MKAYNKDEIAKLWNQTAYILLMGSTTASNSQDYV
jgi:hypothetical protein